MWVNVGDMVTFPWRGQLQTGRVIRIPPGIPKGIVRFLDCDARYYISEPVHFDNMRHATGSEEKHFLAAARKQMEKRYV